MTAMLRSMAALGLLAGRLAALPAAAQDTTTTRSVQEAIRVFLDCNTFCDFDHLRREITYVNWVRDRQDADVHLLITSQSTGGGGQEYTLKYIGLRGFHEMDHELTFVTRQTDTDDEIRNQQTRFIGLGLAFYVARAGGDVAGRIQLTFTPPATGLAAAPQQPRDPWNLWVFRISANGSLSGESQFKRNSISGSLRAERVTAEWKFRFSTSANRSHSSYTLSDGSVSENTTSRYSATSLLVKSLGEHWSVGLDGNVLRSTFENYDVSARIMPEIEFDVFPYSESTRRQFTFVYALGLVNNNYRDTTLFDKLAETRPFHSLSAGAAVVQPWGTIYARAMASNYLDDFSKNRLSINGSCEIRLVRGLNLNFYGSYSRVRDQLSILKGDLTDEDIFLRLKQLKTAYYYSASVGLSYTFGSKFNNVVNPRFGGGGGNCECFGGSCFCF